MNPVCAFEVNQSANASCFLRGDFAASLRDAKVILAS